MHHPFAELIGLQTLERRPGYCECRLTVASSHLNPNGVVHGAVLFAMADIGMGGVVQPSLPEGEICATVEIKINYFKPVQSGELRCITRIVNRGKTLANLDSEIFCADVLVAKANGTYAIFRPRGATN